MQRFLIFHTKLCTFKQGSAHGVILQHDDYNELIEKNNEKDIIIDILRSENELLKGGKRYHLKSLWRI